MYTLTKCTRLEQCQHILKTNIQPSKVRTYIVLIKNIEHLKHTSKLTYNYLKHLNATTTAIKIATKVTTDPTG